MSDASPVPRSTVGARLEVLSLGEGRWSLRDRSVSPSNPAHVVAYVEQIGTSFDVVWLRGKDLPTRFGTFAEVSACALLMLRESTSHGATRPVPIPHRAPAPH